MGGRNRGQMHLRAPYIFEDVGGRYRRPNAFGSPVYFCNLLGRGGSPSFRIPPSYRNGGLYSPDYNSIHFVYYQLRRAVRTAHLQSCPLWEMPPPSNCFLFISRSPAEVHENQSLKNPIRNFSFTKECRTWDFWVRSARRRCCKHIDFILFYEVFRTPFNPNAA